MLVFTNIEGYCVEQFAFFNSGNEAPIILGPDRSRHRLFDVRCARARRLINLLFCGGILNRESLSRNAVHEFAIHKHLPHYWLLTSRNESSKRSSALSISSRVIIRGGSMRI